MRNPIRRNRNIGTSKQGRSRDNRLVIPTPAVASPYFYERLGKHGVSHIQIGPDVFTFLVEETREGVSHAVSVEDICAMLTEIPVEDLTGLRYIVLRQPTRKEERLRPVWGRFIYSFEYKEDSGPAIILEAIDPNGNIEWPRSQRPEERAEFERLQQDGHAFVANRRSYVSDIDLNAVRNTQLFRTLPHEIGHYVHYLHEVEKPYEANPDLDFLTLWETFHAIPTPEKEKFAHRYADKTANMLIRRDWKLPGSSPG